MDIIGIDFGNINSFPGYVSGIDENTHRGGVETVLLPPNDARIGIPTTFHIGNHGKTYGETAATSNPKKNRRNLLKRRMGDKEDIAGETVYYDEVITEMIKYIVDKANDEMTKSNLPMTNCISLAYPVVFSIAQKEHLKELAEKAVLKSGENVRVVGMIPEPVAAALEYLGTLQPNKSKKDYTVLVYDLGGGTFDATIVTAHQNSEGVFESYEVIDQQGSENAGNEFTDCLVDLIKEKLSELGADLPTNDSAKQKLKDEAERLKIRLSEEMYGSYEDEDENNVDISRSELEQATRYIVDETLKVTKQLYNRCRIKPEMIILTGGQSQMPIIKTRIADMFPSISEDLIKIYKPQQAIAFGAARFGELNCVTREYNNTSTKTAVVRPRTGRMLGLANVVNKGEDRTYVCELIARNTLIPMDQPATHAFSNTYPTIKHTIYLSEAKNEEPDIFNEDDFKTIAKLEIDFGIEEPAIVDFEVSVYIDATNTIHFSAQDPNGKFTSMGTQVSFESYVGG